MKIKLEKIKTIYTGCLKIATKSLPIRLSYAIAKNVRVLEEEVKIIEEQRMNIVKKHAVIDENGKLIEENGKYKILEENESAFDKEYEELMQQETEINIHTVSSDVYDLLEDARYDILTAGEMVILDFMVMSQENVVEEVEPKA